MKLIIRFLTILAILYVIPCVLSAQEGDEYVGKAGHKYIAVNLSSIKKYNKRADNLQARLLAKLSRQETKYAKRLKKYDSTTYARLQQQQITYDSISKLHKSPHEEISKRQNNAIDSLLSINKYLESKGHVHNGNGENGIKGHNDELLKAQANLNKNTYINNLIKQRSGNLKSIHSTSKVKSKYLKRLDRSSFYGLEKIRVLKQMCDEPSDAEQKALEILQGQDGFDKYLSNASGVSERLKGASVSDLDKMGYQTKKKVNAQISDKLGSSSPAIQQQMAGQVREWNDKTKDLNQAKSQVKQYRKSMQSLGQDKPSFKVNPMRGMPFSKRLEKQFNWQTNRATIDGNPAAIQLSAMIGFKHSPNLSYGAGIATAVGLGQNWSSAKISFEGVGIRTYATHKLVFGIAAYAGYEKMFKKAAFISKDSQLETLSPSPHNTDNYQESILIGFMKSYRINEKRNGGIQLLYDLWWREKGLKSPIQLRFTMNK